MSYEWHCESTEQMVTNEIHSGVTIDVPQFKIGRYNEILPGVEIIPFGRGCGPVEIGDCNVIHENVRILVGKQGFKLGDYNVLHNHLFVAGDVAIGHNGWFGQGSHLDGTGGLTIGNGVTVGLYCCIWSHVARGSLLDGCLLHGTKPTAIEDLAWLVGNGVHVAPGVRIGKGSIILANAAVTHDTEPYSSYCGIPTTTFTTSSPGVGIMELSSLPGYWLADSELTPEFKFNLMYEWFREFAGDALYINLVPHLGTNFFIATDVRASERLAVVPEFGAMDEDTSYFNYVDSTYTKRLTKLERDWMRFLRNKANFVPRQG